MNKKLLLSMLLASAGMFAQDKVNFKAEITNRNADSVVIQGRNFKKVIKGKDGKFSDSFEAPQGMYQFFDGSAEYTQLYLTPGADITLKTDAKMFDETLAYSGKGSKENNILAYFAIEQEKLEPLMEKDDQAGFMSGFSKLSKDVTARLADKEVNETFRTQMTMNLQQTEKQLQQMFEAKAAMAKLNGNASPLFEYENHKGGKTKLADLYKGKYVYIDTWATWCGPCRQEIPFLQKVEEKYHGKNIEFVSISIDEKKDYEKWKKFVVDKKLGGVQLYADNAWKSEWVQAFAINSIPRFILIGPDGKVIDSDAERPSDPNLVARLDKLVK